MDIIDLLAQKHWKDIFVRECRTGGSWAGQLQTIDAWAMCKSWAHPTVYGYEIKVSRGDFLRDRKWQGYLPYCTDFYFVCPAGIIQADELPKEVGLLWQTKPGKRLYTKKKAPTRQVEIPNSIYRYVLMSRVKIVSSYEIWHGNQDSKDRRIDYWANWLKDKEVNYELGTMVSKNLRKRIKEKITISEAENKRLRERIKQVEAIEKKLKEFGINPNSWSPAKDIQRRHDEVYGNAPPDILPTVKNLIKNLTDFRNKLLSK